MKTIEEFFKNKIIVDNYNCDENVSRFLQSESFRLKHMYQYKNKLNH